MKKLILILLIIFLIGVFFLCFLVGASSHNFPNKTYLILAILVITIFTLLITLSQKLDIFKYWILLFVAEILVVFRYKDIQPECEPCLPNVYCPPCVSDEQILLKYFGISLLIIFLGKQMIQWIKNSAIR
jgi:hypothetical protein